MIGAGDLVNVERELGKGDDPGLALVAGAAAVIVRGGVDRCKVHSGLGQVGKQVLVVLEDRLPRAGLVRADELALYARSALRQPLRLELIAVNVVGRESEVSRQPERLGSAEVDALQVPQGIAETVLRVAGKGVHAVSRVEPVGVTVEARSEERRVGKE